MVPFSMTLSARKFDFEVTTFSTSNNWTTIQQRAIQVYNERVIVSDI